VGTKDGRLVTLDASTGAVVWTVRLRAAVDASPVIAPNGLLLVGNIQSAFYALR
jgi:outer membrane protein assembly factor BamB